MDIVAKNGLGVSYDRVQNAELSLTKQLCKMYNEEGLVCPSSWKSAIDNIDYNPSSNTSRQSFHGTSILMFHHPEASVEIEKIEITNIEGKGINLEFPENYTVLPPTKSTSP